MMKKMIGLLVALCMLALMLPGTAVKSAATPPSVEDILNDYHAKAFEQNRESAEGGAAAYARSGSGKTLEQETVETLRNAGYDAYNVTAENYDAMEDDLNTDLSAMGIDRDGSYIVVISGEEENSANSNSRAGGSFIEQDQGDLGGSTEFRYTYDGTTYTMRYVLVTSADNPKFCASDNTPLISSSSDAAEINGVLNSILYFLIDGKSGEGPIGLGTILDLCGIELVNLNFTYNNTLSLIVSVEWTYAYTQVLCTSSGLWSNRSKVDYVSVEHWFVGKYYNNETNALEDINSKIIETGHSEHYFDYEWRKRMAARGQRNSNQNYEFVGDICIYNPLEEFSLINPPEMLFYFPQPVYTGP